MIKKVKEKKRLKKDLKYFEKQYKKNPNKNTHKDLQYARRQMDEFRSGATGFKKYDSTYKRKESPFTNKKLLNEVSSQLKAASKKHAGQAAKIDKATSAMKKKRSATGKSKIHRTINPFDKHERVDAHGLGAKGLNKRRIKIRKDKDTPKVGAPSPMSKISASCKAQAKKKFKVWPSAYASGWGVRCTRGDFKKKK